MVLNVSTDGYISITRGAYILLEIRHFEMKQYFIIIFIDMHKMDEHINTITKIRSLLHDPFESDLCGLL